MKQQQAHFYIKSKIDSGLHESHEIQTDVVKLLKVCAGAEVHTDEHILHPKI